VPKKKNQEPVGGSGDEVESASAITSNRNLGHLRML
jgi:hypothetical protein